MRNLKQAFLLTLAIVGTHTGIALGARWSEIGTGLPPGAVAPVATLIVDPQNGSTLYAQTHGRSIFKSTDGGESWKALSSIADVRVLALDPTSASTIAKPLEWKFTNADLAKLLTKIAAHENLA